MMAEMSRHDLKKNELADVVVAAVTWIKNNRNLFLSIAGTALAVIILAVFFFSRYSALSARAADKVSMSQALFAQGRPDQAAAQLDEVINKFPHTQAASEARLMKADLLILQKNYDQAEKTVLPVTENGKPKNVVPLAYSTLGTVEEDAGKFQDAVKTYTSFLDKFPEHFMAPRIYESLGRVYELLGSIADAKATYEKLSTLYPATGWAQHAQDRLAALAGQAPSTPAPSAGRTIPQNAQP
jgi:TolA-binding protein